MKYIPYGIGIVLWGMTSTVLGQEELKRELYRGQQRFDKEDYAGALEHYQQAVDHHPLDFKARYHLANTYFRLNEYEKAVDHYLRVAELSPTAQDRSRVQHNLGNALMMNQQLDEAIAAYQQGLRLSPSDEDTRYNLAYALRLKQQQQRQDNANKRSQGEGEQQRKGEQENTQEGAQQQASAQQETQQEAQQAGNRTDPPSGEEAQQGESTSDQNGDAAAAQPPNGPSQSRGAAPPEQQPKSASTPYAQQMSKEEVRQLLEKYYKREKAVQHYVNTHQQTRNGAPKRKDW